MPGTDWLAKLPTDRLIAEYSMWSADLIRLADDLARIEGHADVLHVDVADGHFAPALLFFPDLVAKLRGATDIPIHVHLMVADAVLVSQVEQFADAGADLISIHAENAAVADEALAVVKARRLAAGIVLRVETPVAACKPFPRPGGFPDAARYRHRREGAGARSRRDRPAARGQGADLGFRPPHRAGCGWRHSRHTRCLNCAPPARRPSSWDRWPSARTISPARMRWLHEL
jgi:hypothetical protein